MKEKVKKTSKPLAITSGVLFLAASIAGGYFFWYTLQATNFTDQIVQRRGGIASLTVNNSSENTNTTQTNTSDQTGENNGNSDQSQNSQNENQSQNTSTEITAETYAGANQQFVEELYQPGEYINLYEMNLRDGPSVENGEIGTLQPGAGFNVTEIVADSTTIWGGDEAGQWIALQEEAVIYCFGPGLYQTIEATPVYDSAGSDQSSGELEAGWSVYIKQVENHDGVLWGILEDNKAIKLYENETELLSR